MLYQATVHEVRDDEIVVIYRREGMPNIPMAIQLPDGEVTEATVAALIRNKASHALRQWEAIERQARCAGRAEQLQGLLGLVIEEVGENVVQI